jgi:hypothetical protein
MPEFDRACQAAHYLIGTSAFDMHLPRGGKTLPTLGMRWDEVGKEQCGHIHVAHQRRHSIPCGERTHDWIKFRSTSLHFTSNTSPCACSNTTRHTVTSIHTQTEQSLPYGFSACTRASSTSFCLLPFTASPRLVFTWALDPATCDVGRATPHHNLTSLTSPATLTPHSRRCEKAPSLSRRNLSHASTLFAQKLLNLIHAFSHALYRKYLHIHKVSRSFPRVLHAQPLVAPARDHLFVTSAKIH